MVFYTNAMDLLRDGVCEGRLVGLPLFLSYLLSFERNFAHGYRAIISGHCLVLVEALLETLVGDKGDHSTVAHHRHFLKIIVDKKKRQSLASKTT